jgi:hypothetical protein
LFDIRAVQHSARSRKRRARRLGYRYDQLKINLKLALIRRITIARCCFFRDRKFVVAANAVFIARGDFDAAGCNFRAGRFRDRYNQFKVNFKRALIGRIAVARRCFFRDCKFVITRYAVSISGSKFDTCRCYVGAGRSGDGNKQIQRNLKLALIGRITIARRRFFLDREFVIAGYAVSISGLDLNFARRNVWARRLGDGYYQL